MNDWMQVPPTQRRRAIEERLSEAFRGNYGNTTIKRLSALLWYVSDSPNTEIPLTRIAVEAPDLTVAQIHHAVEFLNNSNGLFGWFAKTPDKKHITWMPEGGVDLPPKPIPPTEHRARRGDVSRLVLEFATQHPGVMVTLSEYTAGTGLTEKQVQASIYEYNQHGRAGRFEVNQRGCAWTYYPPKAADDRDGKLLIVEVLTELPQGTLVLLESGDVKGLVDPKQMF